MYAIRRATENVLERPFAKMGARVKFEDLVPNRRQASRGPVTLDVRRDKEGEYFLISKTAEARLEVLDVRPADRHLLLLTRVMDDANRETKARFLLGHDERHWFVAAIPERDPVSTVRAAKQALKPAQVIRRELSVRIKTRHDRSNKVRIRQGEWFFVPVTHLRVGRWMIREQEPLVRGNGSKPHICQELHRVGGETVYVHNRYPNGLTLAAFARLSEAVRSQPGWRTMVRNPRVFVRGTVRHSDHRTILLEGWHEVFMNTETRAVAMRNVAFLD